MLISDNFLYFLRKSNPEDSLLKTYHIKCKSPLYSDSNLSLTASDANLHIKIFENDVLKKEFDYTSGFSIFSKTYGVQYEVLVTGECSKIKVYNTFANYPDVYFLNYNLDGITAFESFTGANIRINGIFPEIWTYTKYKNTNHAGCFSGGNTNTVFRSMTNYNDVPEDWK